MRRGIKSETSHFVNVLMRITQLAFITAIILSMKMGFADSDPSPWKRGSFSGVFKISGVESTYAFPNVHNKEGYTDGVALQLPFAEAVFFVGPYGGGGFNFKWQLKGGEEVYAQVKFSHLEGSTHYHMALDWDLPSGRIECYLNGVPQGDLMHGKSISDLTPESYSNDTNLAGSDLYYDGEKVGSIRFEDTKLSTQGLNFEILRKEVAGYALRPVEGEFRRIYNKPLNLDGLEKERVFSTSFGEETQLIHERELLDDCGIRQKIPPEDSWVLEGENVQVHYERNGLRLTSTEPNDKRNGAMVLWRNSQLPENYLIEYIFTPEDSSKGLNILFMNAKSSSGGSIFELDQSPREGIFGKYIVGDIDNYHFSPWATDEGSLRHTTNFRKNSGFHIVAIGDDRIGQYAKNKVHIVRVLRMGNTFSVEADGLLVLEWQDTGEHYGPIHLGGIAGLRFMAHTHSVLLNAYTVYSIAAGMEIKPLSSLDESK